MSGCSRSPLLWRIPVQPPSTFQSVLQVPFKSRISFFFHFTGLSVHLVSWNELQGRGVHAVPLPCGFRSIIKDVPEVSTAPGTEDLAAHHPQAEVLPEFNIVR